MDSQAIGSTAGVSSTLQDASRPYVGGVTKPSAANNEIAPPKETEAAPTKEVQLQRDPRSLQYQVDSTTHRVVAIIIEEGSKRVIRQIPDAEVLRIAKAIDRMQGFLVDGKA